MAYSFLLTMIKNIPRTDEAGGSITLCCTSKKQEVTNTVETHGMRSLRNLCRLVSISPGHLLVGFSYFWYQVGEFSGLGAIQSCIPVGRVPFPVNQQLAQNVQVHTFPQQPRSKNVPQSVEYTSSRGA